jgi:predicted amidohydrolase YtcJ
MELLFRNGNILTMEKKWARADALSVQFGRILAVGPSAKVAKQATAETRIIDLGGRTLLPGFIDTHNHFCLYAFLTDQVDCRAASGCAAGEDVVQALRERAGRTPAGQWVIGWGYAPYLLSDRKEITRHDLDRASKDHPIVLVHVSVHGAVVNSLALRKLRFSRKTPDPPGGVIHREAGGVPNGVLSESAFMGPLFFNTPSIYAEGMAGYEREDRVAMMARCAALYHRLGIVGVHDPFVDGPTLRTYQEAETQGRLPLRLRAYVLNRWADPIIAAGVGSGFGSPELRIGAIKIFLDGGMSSRTAAVSRPYAQGGSGKGILNYAQAELTREIRRFHRAGYPVSVHAQGDRALGNLLKAFEAAGAHGNLLRHHVVHAGNITPSQIERAAVLGLYITSQANFFSLLGDGFLEAFGPRRSRGLYPFRTLLKSNIRLALSSDCPVADPDPRIGLRDAICRRTGSGAEFGLSECLTPEEALSLYTREAAYFSFEEDDTGTLRPGKRADLVVLDKDPTRVDPEKIPECRVLMTVVGGKVVHDELTRRKRP